MAHFNNARPVSYHHPMNTSVRRRHRHRAIRGETGLRPVLLRQTATSVRQRSSMKKVANELVGVEDFGAPGSGKMWHCGYYATFAMAAASQYVSILRYLPEE